MPDYPLTPLAQIAAALHELFTSLTTAGFTEAQALYLVGKHVEGTAEKAS